MSERPLTLMEVMQNIRDKINTESKMNARKQHLKPVGEPIIRKSQVQFQELSYSQVARPQQQQSLVDEMTKSKLQELEMQTDDSKQIIKSLISHVNQHMKKLSDAVLTLQDEVTNLKVENAALKEFIIQQATERALVEYHEKQEPYNCHEQCNCQNDDICECECSGECEESSGCECDEECDH